jgi:hypothetical protein
MNEEMHSKIMIERVWRLDLGLRLSELSDAFGGYDRARLETPFDVRGFPLAVIKIHDRSKRVHVLG